VPAAGPRAPAAARPGAQPTQVYEELLVGNELRNERIAGLARERAAAGRSVLVLVDRVRHGELLLPRLGSGASFLHGGMPGRALAETTARFAGGELPCLVATAGLFQEGVSIDGIQVLIQAGGLKSRARVIQAIGRGMRRAPGKQACAYVDFWDDDEGGVLRGHSRRRLQTLLAEGFRVPAFATGTAGPAEQEPVAASWSHVAGSDRFLLVDGEGSIMDRARCLLPELVPRARCRRCTSDRRNACTAAVSGSGSAPGSGSSSVSASTFLFGAASTAPAAPAAAAAAAAAATAP